MPDLTRQKEFIDAFYGTTDLVVREIPTADQPMTLTLPSEVLR